MLSYFGVIAALIFVLMLIGVAMRGLRRVSAGMGLGRGRLPMEVVQRVAISQKQGIAVVRIGTQVIAVSVGEGGVRPLMEITGDDRHALLEPAPAPPALTLARLPVPAHFRDAIRQAMRSAAMSVALVATLAASAAAQAPVVPGTRAPVVQPQAQAPAAAPAAAPDVGQMDEMIPRIAPQIDLRVGDQAEGGLRLSGTVGVVIMMGLLTLLPTLLLMMTSFTRILIVLHFLRQALGTQSAPPGHLIAALALLLTGFVMGPTFSEINRTALQPWMEGRMEQGEMLATASGPLRTFMLGETRDSDLNSFMEMSASPTVASRDEVPLVVLMSAFVTSELRTAFQIGFAIFLPFIIIDIVVASVLMSMGMMMLPPAMIALPFKLLLFVLVDGWALIVQGLVASFH